MKNKNIFLLIGLVFIILLFILFSFTDLPALIFGAEEAITAETASQNFSDAEQELLNAQGSAVAERAAVLDVEKYSLPIGESSWLGSDSNRWNAAFNFAELENVRVIDQLKVGQNTVTFATETIGFSSSATSGVIFGSGITDAGFSFLDTAQNVLAKLTDGATFPIFEVFGRLDVDRDINVNSDNARGITFSRYDSLAGNAPFISFRRQRGSQASPTAVIAGDLLGDFEFQGFDGTNLHTTAKFSALVEDAVSTDSIPTAFVFSTGVSSSTVSEKFRVTATGKIGIGTTTPSHKLSVAGDVNLTGDLLINSSAISTTSANGWADDGVTARLATISDSIGIGAVSPAEKLQLSSGNLLLDNDFTINFKDSGGASRLVLNYCAANMVHLRQANASAGALQIINENAIDGAIKFFSGGLNERLRLTAAGLIGVNTTAPTQQLDINGKIRIDNDTATATAGALRWTGTEFQGFDGVQWLSFGREQFSGTVYSDEGVTPLGGVLVRLAINGVDNATTTTNAITGAYSLQSTTAISAGDILTFYLENETADAVTVTVADGGSIPLVNLYQNRLIVRHDNSGSLTNANLSTAAIAGETDISNIYSVSAGALTVADNKELFILSSHTFAPGGAVTVDDIDINGTFTMGANTVTVSGAWDAAGGSFSSSGTVTFTATSAQNIFSGGNFFNNLTINGVGGAFTLEDALDVNGNLTITNGTLDVKASENNSINIAGNYTNNGTLAEQSGTVTFDGSGAQTLSGSDLTFYNLTINNSAGSPSDSTDVDPDATVTVTNTLTVTDGQFSPPSSSDFAAITIGANGIFKPDSTASITVSGNWSNSGTFTHNSGTTTFDGLSQTFSGATTFNNFRKIEGANDATDEVLTFTANSTTTIAGAWTLDGRDADDRINLVSSIGGTQWKVDPQGARSLDFIDVADSNNINAAAVNCAAAECTDAVNSGNNTNWTFIATPPAAEGTSGACSSGGSSLDSTNNTICATNTDIITVTGIDGGTNQLYLAAVAIFGQSGQDVTVGSITGGGLTWSKVIDQCGARLTGSRTEVWKAFGSPASAFTATITLSDPNNEHRISSASISRYSGVDTISPIGSTIKRSNNNGTLTTPICGTGSDNSQAIISGMATVDPNSTVFLVTHTRRYTISATSTGFTPRKFIRASDGGDGANLYVHDRVFATASSSISAKHTLSSATGWEMIGLTINP